MAAGPHHAPPAKPPALLVAALVAAGCGAANGAPAVAVARAEAAPARVATPAPPPVRPASEPCTAPAPEIRHRTYAPKPLTPAQEQQIPDAEAYVRDHANPSDAQSKARLAESAYARARVFFEAKRWAEAAVAFREIAVGYADTDLGIYAAQLYLESINVLGSRVEPARPACYDDMERDVPIFLDLYCKGAITREHREECTILRSVQRDIDRLRIEAMVKRANYAETGATRLYEEAGAAYLALAYRCCDEARSGGASPQASRCDEIAFNAGRAFLAAKLPDRAREAEAILMDPRNQLQKSPLTEKLVKVLERLP
jgi:hypothetical protein